jgi:hypothetical protein
MLKQKWKDSKASLIARNHKSQHICILIGGFNPLKNISQIGSSSQLLGKIKNVPNHQPVYIYIPYAYYLGKHGSTKFNTSLPDVLKP